MAGEAKRKRRQTLLLERPVKLHRPEGYGESSRTTWERMNTHFSMHYGTGGHAPAHYYGPHPLASELDIHGTPHKFKPNAHRSRQWRKYFGRGAVRMSAKGFIRVPEGVGMTFQQWLDAGCPKFEWVKAPTGYVNADDQVSAYMRSGTVTGRFTSKTSALEETERKH